MGVTGIGVDVCSVARIEAALAEHGDAFAARVLTERERTEAPSNASTLAKRWAMKEAISKALGTGIGAAFGFHDIEIRHTAQGAPMADIGKLPKDVKVFVSVSDDAGIAVAYAVVEDRHGNA